MMTLSLSSLSLLPRFSIIRHDLCFFRDDPTAPMTRGTDADRSSDLNGYNSGRTSKKVSSVETEDQSVDERSLSLFIAGRSRNAKKEGKTR